MGNLPTLNSAEMHVLQILLERSNIAGYELMKLTGDMPTQSLMDAVKTLRRNELIQVVGNSLTEKDFEFSRFAVLPTAKSIAGMLIR